VISQGAPLQKAQTPIKWRLVGATFFWKACFHTSATPVPVNLMRTEANETRFPRTCRIQNNAAIPRPTRSVIFSAAKTSSGPPS
jgi:hypothetical protein